jgi:hypothetical protein
MGGPAPDNCVPLSAPSARCVLVLHATKVCPELPSLNQKGDSDGNGHRALKQIKPLCGAEGPLRCRPREESKLDQAGRDYQRTNYRGEAEARLLPSPDSRAVPRHARHPMGHLDPVRNNGSTRIAVLSSSASGGHHHAWEARSSRCGRRRGSPTAGYSSWGPMAAPTSRATTGARGRRRHGGVRHRGRRVSRRPGRRRAGRRPSRSRHARDGCRAPRRPPARRGGREAPP